MGDGKCITLFRILIRPLGAGSGEIMSKGKAIIYDNFRDKDLKLWVMIDIGNGVCTNLSEF